MHLPTLCVETESRRVSWAALPRGGSGCPNADSHTAFATVVTSDCSYRTVLILPHAPRGNASADGLRRNWMTQIVIGGFEHAVGQVASISTDTPHSRPSTPFPSPTLFRSNQQNRDEPEYCGSELAHETFADC